LTSLLKKNRWITPLLIFIKTKHFIQNRFFEKLPESCRKVAGKLPEISIGLYQHKRKINEYRYIGGPTTIKRMIIGYLFWIST
jgi:hypothetical protein